MNRDLATVGGVGVPVEPDLYQRKRFVDAARRFCGARSSMRGAEFTAPTLSHESDLANFADVCRSTLGGSLLSRPLDEIEKARV
jgi:hypothetical protein